MRPVIIIFALLVVAVLLIYIYYLFIYDVNHLHNHGSARLGGK